MNSPTTMWSSIFLTLGPAHGRGAARIRPHAQSRAATRKPTDAIILAVAHDQFRAMGAGEIRMLGKDQHVLYDLKYILKVEYADLHL